MKRTAIKRSMRPIKQRNEKRIAKKAANYQKVIASDFHKKLRFDAFQRSGGWCECEECVTLRRQGFLPTQKFFDEERLHLAWVRTFAWFTKKGGEPHKRFRSTDGELHHDSYKFFGDENPAEIQHVRWVWKSCHQRIEAEHGTRRRFLKGGR